MSQYKPERTSREVISDALIATHLKRIYLQIYRIVQSIEDAQELTQDVFIKALSSAGSLKASDKAGHWLSRIASNVAIDFLRRRRPEYNAISNNEYRHSAKHINTLTERERTGLSVKRH